MLAQEILKQIKQEFKNAERSYGSMPPAEAAAARKINKALRRVVMDVLGHNIQHMVGFANKRCKIDSLMANYQNIGTELERRYDQGDDVYDIEPEELGPVMTTGEVTDAVYKNLKLHGDL